MKIKIWKWVIKKLPVSEKDIPNQWKVGTRVTIFGNNFIIWEL